MAHIIALQGTSNSGKTSTLIQVLNDLQSKYPSTTVKQFHRGENDIKVVLYGINGQIVGIESQGDPSSKERVEKRLVDLLNEKCDIIFCTCRTRGKTFDWVKGLAPTHNVQFIPQIPAALGTFANANSAAASVLIKLAGL